MSRITVKHFASLAISTASSDASPKEPAERSYRLKKRRGLFYTPASVAKSVSRWAIRGPRERILEPSFGGCEFLSAAHRRLTQLGNNAPWKHIFGCDIDHKAFTRYLAQLCKVGAIDSHFVQSDFLRLTPRDFGAERFHAVIGNPPYVSHHNMFKNQKTVAQQIGYDDDFNLSGLSSLWAYFVFHSIRFILPGGRMAWLLPSSAVHADYGRELLDYLSRRFHRVVVASLQEKYFQEKGATETTEILLCEGLDINPSRFVEARKLATLQDFSKLIHSWNKSREAPGARKGITSRKFVSRSGAQLLYSIASSPGALQLGQVSRLAIGIVTGANRFFIVSRDTAKKNALPRGTLSLILAKMTQARGLDARLVDLEASQEKGDRCLLVGPNNRGGRGAISKYFQQFPQPKRLSNATFGKRSDWRIADDKKIPGGFLSYMHHNGPRLILNSAKVNCTNTIHRVYFHKDLRGIDRKLAAITMQSTISQLSAEIEGRLYGGGVLKHELGDASRILLLYPLWTTDECINRVFRKMDTLLRGGKNDEARNVVDDFLRHSHPELITLRGLRILRRQLRILRRRRQRLGKS